MAEPSSDQATLELPPCQPPLESVSNADSQSQPRPYRSDSPAGVGELPPRLHSSPRIWMQLEFEDHSLESSGEHADNSVSFLWPDQVVSFLSLFVGDGAGEGVVHTPHKSEVEEREEMISPSWTCSGKNGASAGRAALCLMHSRCAFKKYFPSDMTSAW